MAPRFFVPPTAQFQPVATMHRVAPQPCAATVAVAPAQVHVPLTPQAAAPQFAPQVPFTSQAVAPLQFGERIILREQPEVSVSDELDTFYARLAKIRLEQRQLDEALALIQNIKSETFRVRTVVSLAEYVSRDRSFQTESDTLFRLALAGMEALDRGEPFRIEISGARNIQQPIAPPPPVVPPVVTPTPVPPIPAPVVPPAVVVVEPAPLPPDPPVTPPDTGTRPSLLFDPPDPPVTMPPELSPGDPAPRPPLILEEETVGRHNGNGRQPPPPPPRGNGVDGIAISPPENQPVFPELAPPARTTEDNGSIPQAPLIPTPLIPIPLEDEVPPPDSSITVPTPAPPVTVSEPLPFVRPVPAIPLTDNGNGMEAIEVTPRQEPEQPPPPPVRQLPRIILDEN